MIFKYANISNSGNIYYYNRMFFKKYLKGRKKEKKLVQIVYIKGCIT